MRIGFKYYDGLKFRESLGMSANKQTIAEARRLCATIQLELKARTFDYAKRFPDSDRIKQRGIETPEKIQPISVTELADSWLLSKQGEVKKSTHGYYKEVAGPSFSATQSGRKRLWAVMPRCSTAKHPFTPATGLRRAPSHPQHSCVPLRTDRELYSLANLLLKRDLALM
jgi:hypothetical protein